MKSRGRPDSNGTGRAREEVCGILGTIVHGQREDRVPKFLHDLLIPGPQRPGISLLRYHLLVIIKGKNRKWTLGGLDALCWTHEIRKQRCTPHVRRGFG